MDKNEILEKSRKENKNQDVYEKEVIKDGWTFGAAAAAILATIFFVIQILLGEGMNYGLYAVVFAIPSAVFIVKSIRLKRKHEIVFAVLYTFTALGLSAAQIVHLFAVSAVL